jgi:hypothetical protein
MGVTIHKNQRGLTQFATPEASGCSVSHQNVSRLVCGFAALAFAALVFHAPAKADEKADLQALIGRQLDSIVRGTSQQVGVTLRDGSVMKAVRRKGQAIEIDMQLPIARTAPVIEPSFQERRQTMQGELCSGETLKLIRSGVSWVYRYTDKYGRPMESITIDRCQ